MAKEAGKGRRAEYAELTRQAITEAARDLFISQGYFATKVDEIARAARVAPATVYAVGGGKSGLLRALLLAGTESEDIAGILERLRTATDPAELLAYTVHVTREQFEAWSPLMRQVAAAAAQDPAVRESQDIAHRSMRAGLELTTHRLDELGALGVPAGRAVDLLWLHLCNAAYFIRTDDLGWTLDESEKWLCETLPGLILTTPEPGGRTSTIRNRESPPPSATRRAPARRT
ncbi:TetR/AcrR family transcriptional regulator [Kineosporia sp. J2-2]|uniref:TetR/AcrR family transcriptional regulator n=1 Tax=Kineosporia corallincola TaxID=2835133 RepID=A0ABS5TQL2_9ACTN|nr:TetR/AcrR family transcriptional regulator [Kineosporia corallincola]MBT0773213.1 TetR/AcrR family transcriptional regulator [Kineosporia corallincola]